MNPKSSAKAKPTEQDMGETSNTTENVNKFSDDGSFLAQFMNKQKKDKPSLSAEDSTTAKHLSTPTEENTNDKAAAKVKTVEINQTQQQGNKRKVTVGKMGGFTKKIAPTKKPKQADEKSSGWQAYLDEVKKYKDASGCSDSDLCSRPLVK